MDNSKRTKIKIGMAVDSNQESEITRQSVDNDRKLFLQVIIYLYYQYILLIDVL